MAGKAASPMTKFIGKVLEKEDKQPTVNRAAKRDRLRKAKPTIYDKRKWKRTIYEI
jgi:hypothetical protein